MKRKEREVDEITRTCNQHGIDGRLALVGDKPKNKRQPLLIDEV
jgi:5,10-methylenetetrahydrofolate reductase